LTRITFTTNTIITTFSTAMTNVIAFFTSHILINHYFPFGKPLANQSINFLKGYKINFKSFLIISIPKLLSY